MSYILKDVVALRRKEHPEEHFLSDWQVHSANLVSIAISCKVDGGQMDAGPRYLPFPTGSGKTYGAIWGITNAVQSNPDIRICFLSPYKTAVDHVHRKLSERLGEDKVGKYYSGAGLDKAAVLKKQVAVLTHQFVPYNKGRLDDRDVFVVDEVIYATAQVTLDLTDFAKALSWATSQNIKPDAFREAHLFATKFNERLKEDGETRFFAPDTTQDLSWAKDISGIDLYEAGTVETLTDTEAIASVKVFCEALLLGLVFLDRGALGRDGRHKANFNAAILGLPKLDQTVVLTATGGLIYDIAGCIKESISSREFAVPMRYDNVTLVKLSDPAIKGQYKAWTTEATRKVVADYLDWLLPQIAEDEAYVTMPLAVLQRCLWGYFGLGDDHALPVTVRKHGKTLHLSHHQLAIGSNDYKDCPAVIYLWPNYLPRRVTLQNQTALEGERLTDERLFMANSHKLKGAFSRMRDAEFIDNMIQQLGRGRIRQIDDEGNAGKMTAYILSRPEDYDHLARIFCGSQKAELSGFGEIKKPTSRMARIVDYLNRHRGRDVLVSDVAADTEIRADKIQEAVTRNSWDVTLEGFQLQAGRAGRGNAAIFRWVGKTPKDTGQDEDIVVDEG
jgi:hypothetical protein